MRNRDDVENSKDSLEQGWGLGDLSSNKSTRLTRWGGHQQHGRWCLAEMGYPGVQQQHEQQLLPWFQKTANVEKSPEKSLGTSHWEQCRRKTWRRPECEESLEDWGADGRT